MGSLGITMPMIRYKPAMHKQLASLVMGKAKELSKALGYRDSSEDELPDTGALRRARR
jgi:hypothetical protein